jgi:plastocyanin
MKAIIGSKNRIAAGFAILFTIFIISNSCSKSSNTTINPGANEVLMQNSAFDPVTITVATNTTITWTNKDGMAHTVTSNTAGQFDSGTINANGTWSHLFDTPGTFPYHCIFHAGMTGTVIVN